MSMLRRLARSAACILAAIALAGCATAPPAPGPEPLLVLVSIDGFRWDFRARGHTPNLDRLAARGVSAGKLVPVFPTKTFPNHYTIVTGLYPEHHGVVSNTVYDPVFDATYALGKRAEIANGRWYSGEPIWVTAESRGLITAPVFWPGSEAEIGGYRPSHWEPFDGSRTDEERVARLLELLDLPVVERPSFLTLYFDTIDDVVHRLGPDPSAALTAALENVDAMIGRLLQGIDSRHLRESTDIIVLSDHGMSATSRDRVILIDEYVDLDLANPVDWNPVLGLWPREEDRDEVLTQLAGAHPHLHAYRREDVPPELHYRDNRRIPPIIAIADDGWSITHSARFASCAECFTGGNHGFDPRLESMGALFVAAGPSFANGVRIDRLESIHLYELMCSILGLDPAVNDGSLESVPDLLVLSGDPR